MHTVDVIFVGIKVQVLKADVDDFRPPETSANLIESD